MDRQEVLTFHETLIPANIEAPLPWWVALHKIATKVHRDMDRQLMLATDDDIEAWKERKRCSTSQ